MAMDEWTTLEKLGLADGELIRFAHRGSFKRADGVDVEFCNFLLGEKAKHYLLLLTGWDESFVKYGDVIAELVAEGFNVYTMDWRSQGLSGRFLLDPQVTYVESFDGYMDDLEFFIDQIVSASCQVDACQLSCLAHSMGGLIALSAAAKHQGLFQRLVVSSPMLKMKAGMPHAVALRLGQVLCWLGLGKRYAPGEMGVDVSRPIKKKLTTDKDRLHSWEKIRRALPIVAMGGMSSRWVVEAIKAQRWFENCMDQVTVPTMLLQADIDVFVCSSKPFRNLCRAASSCRRLFYPMTYHEILFEKDWARSHAIKSSIAFLKSGERPEAELTVIDPPTTVGGDREMLLTKVLKCVSSLLGTGSTSGCCRCSGAGSSSAAVIRAPSAAGAATSPGGTSDEAHGRPKKSLAAQSNISDRSLPFCSCLSVLAGLGVFGGIGAAVIVFAATHSRDVGWSSIKAPSSSRYK